MRRDQKDELVAALTEILSRGRDDGKPKLKVEAKDRNEMLALIQSGQAVVISRGVARLILNHLERSQ